jgi:hypothetical protein
VSPSRVVTTAVVSAAVVAVTYFAVRTVPDIQRYLKIRRM